MVSTLPEMLALSVGLLAFVAELIHARRIAKVKHLVFGPSGNARMSLRFGASAMRIGALALACWGFASLFWVVQERVHNTDAIDERDYRHLVLLVDVSPSMHLKDAGPDGSQSRRLRASAIVESLFNRIPLRRFKITFIAVYSDAKPLIEDSTDHEAVRSMMEDMPMWHAFESGKTDLMKGISLAAKIAKPWNPDSAYVVMVTDGDSVPAKGMPKLPASVADFFVVGVGDESKGEFIDGHQSRQDVSSLRQIANRLRGIYHNGNEKHLTSSMVGRLAEMKSGKHADRWTRREWALAAVVVGSAIMAILPLLMHYFGSSYQSETRSQILSITQ